MTIAVSQSEARTSGEIERRPCPASSSSAMTFRTAYPWMKAQDDQVALGTAAG
jgi:hypothetical protein